MGPAEFVSKWTAEAEAMQHRKVQVDGAALLEEVLDDFSSVMEAQGEACLSLRQAAIESGYSADYLGRLVRSGVIPNAGRPKAPRILRKNLPRKASALRHAHQRLTLKGADRWQIARSVVESEKGLPR